MAAGSTYTPIATYTVSSSQANYTFSSLPSSYTDLVLVVSGTASGNDGVNFQFNSDTSSSYSYTQVYGNGTSALSNRSTSGAAFAYFGTSNSTVIMQVMNYSNTSTYKTTLYRGNNANASGTNAGVSLWRNTAAINSMKVYLENAATFSAGTILTIYGLAAA